MVCDPVNAVRRGQLEQRIAIETAKSEIAKRIRRVCPHFGEAEFAALVEHMAEIEVRYRLRADWLNEEGFGSHALN